jgi:hypothetical protein
MVRASCAFFALVLATLAPASYFTINGKRADNLDGTPNPLPRSRAADQHRPYHPRPSPGAQYVSGRHREAHGPAALLPVEIPLGQFFSEEPVKEAYGFSLSQDEIRFLTQVQRYSAHLTENDRKLLLAMVRKFAATATTSIS